MKSVRIGSVLPGILVIGALAVMVLGWLVSRPATDLPRPSPKPVLSPEPNVETRPIVPQPPPGGPFFPELGPGDPIPWAERTVVFSVLPMDYPLLPIIPVFSGGAIGEFLRDRALLQVDLKRLPNADARHPSTPPIPGLVATQAPQP